MFLDGTDAETEGTFKWMTTDEVLTYTNWVHVNPGDDTANNCVAMDTNGGAWNDIGCDSYQNSVCEIVY